VYGPQPPGEVRLAVISRGNAVWFTSLPLASRGDGLPRPQGPKVHLSDLGRAHRVVRRPGHSDASVRRAATATGDLRMRTILLASTLAGTA
jgi:hypothetical protein